MALWSHWHDQIFKKKGKLKTNYSLIWPYTSRTNEFNLRQSSSPLLQHREIK